MKVSLAVFLIFTFIIGGGIYHNSFIVKSVNSIKKNIDLLDYAVQAENPDLLHEYINKTNSEWQKMRHVLCFLIRHEYIFEVDAAISELESFSVSFDSAEATLSVSKMRASADCILETSSFTIENII